MGRAVLAGLMLLLFLIWVIFIITSGFSPLVKILLLIAGLLVVLLTDMPGRPR